MTETIHEHLHDWLVAAADGSLTEAERAELAAHLAACSHCRHQASDPALVAEQERLMERYGQFPAGLEERVLARLQSTAGEPASASVVPRRSPWWVAWRVGAAVLLAGLLVARTLGAHWSNGTGWTSRMWGAFSRYVLLQPSSSPAEQGAGQGGALASCYQLASHLMGALLWVCLFVLIGQLLLDQWRRRHPLASPLPGVARD
jgi:hypothetical protein